MIIYLHTCSTTTTTTTAAAIIYISSSLTPQTVENRYFPNLNELSGNSIFLMQFSVHFCDCV